MHFVRRAVLATIILASMTSCARGPRATDGDLPCAGLSDGQVAEALATIVRSVASVESKYELVSYPKGSPPQRLVGAVVYVRGAPGLNAPWVTRVLTCQARGRGHDRCEAGDPCPFGVEGSEISAKEAGPGLAITVRSDNPEAAREILRRGKLLLPDSGAP